MLSELNLKRTLLTAFFMKWVIYSFHALFPIHQNHFWRQFDTLGVSARYFQRFFISGNTEPFWHKFLPAVLQSGDAIGITPMEFPLLNLICSPLWGLGPKWGRIACCFTLVSVTYSLCYFLYKKRKNLEGWAFLLLPFVSFSAENIYKFIPDVIASLLVCCAIIYALERRYFFSFLLCLVGALMKPPALAVLFLLFYYRKSFRELIKLDLVWTATSSGLAFLYYKLGVSLVQKFSDVPGFFAIQPRNPIQSIKDVFGDFTGYLLYLNSKAVYWGGTTLLLILIFFHKKGSPVFKLILVFCLSLIFVVALDGAHSIIHDYYYVGVSFSICLIIYHLLFPLSIRGKIHAFIILSFWAATLILHPLELMIHDLRGIDTVFNAQTYEDDCLELKKIASDWPWNQNFAFRSEEQPFPKIGVCFGERVGSKTSPYGLYFKDSPVPGECRTVYQKNQVILAHCP